MDSEQINTTPLVKSPLLRLLGYICVLGIGIFLSADLIVLVIKFVETEVGSEIIGLILSMSILLCCMSVATLLYARIVERVSVAKIGISWPINLKQLTLGGLLSLCFLASMYVICIFMGWLVLTPVFFPWQFGIVLAVFCLFAGITEELIFRGYLLFLIERWKGRAVAIISTSVVFWLIHIFDGFESPILHCIDYLAFSIALCLIRFSFGSLYFPIAFHSVYDWIVFATGQGADFEIQGYFESKVTAPNWLIGPPGEIGIVDTIPTLALLLFAIWTYRKEKT